MSRFKLLHIIAYAYIGVHFSCNGSNLIAGEQGTVDAYKVPIDEQPDLETYNKINNEYQRVLAMLIPDNHPLKALYEQGLQREKIMLQDGNLLDSPDGQIWLASLYQPLTLTFFHSSLKLRSVHNYALEKYLEGHKEEIQKVPTLTPDQAMTKGREYFKLLGFTLPPNYRLDKLDFNASNPSLWTIRWQRYAGDFAYYSNQLLDDYASVSFHETLGIGTCAVQSFLPEPISLVVSVSSEEAVVKASKVVPLIEDTPYYLRGRVPGFVLRSLKEATLRVVIPNWLLDPARVTWIHDKVPSEVRLCWVVRFSTVNGKPEPDPKYHLVPPDIIVYIDAKTGEVVGGTFT